MFNSDMDKPTGEPISDLIGRSKREADIPLENKQRALNEARPFTASIDTKDGEYTTGGGAPKHIETECDGYILLTFKKGGPGQLQAQGYCPPTDIASGLMDLPSAKVILILLATLADKKPRH